VPEFKKATRHNKVDAAETDTTWATARLPGLDIEIMHRRAVEGGSEQISINLRPMPSFKAFARALEVANPFAFWAQGAQFAWLSWLEATRTLIVPWALAPSLPGHSADPTSRSEQKRGLQDQPWECGRFSALLPHDLVRLALCRCSAHRFSLRSARRSKTDKDGQDRAAAGVI
jgi:hypothetical protein